MKQLLFTLLLLFGAMRLQAETPVNPVGLSAELLASVRYGGNVAGILKVMAELEESALAVALVDDAAKKTFWINVYNAMVQHKLKQDTSEYVNRMRFFGKRDVVVAGKKLSLDDIEHRMLRRSQIKWAMGHVRRPFASAFEKAFRVDSLDWRVHFALNCGAMSCPAIESYQAHSIDEQLETATTLFLMFEVEYDSTQGQVQLPKLFKWYRGDFGGKKGIYKILQDGEYIPVESKPKLVYKPYDWTLSVSNFR